MNRARALIAAIGLLALSPSASANPVLRGDFPDPSVIRVDNTYYATATSSAWSPIFQLLKSTDLHSWQPIGSVFPSRPAWAVSDFWAPELFRNGDKFLVYYAAKKVNGPLCVGVAVASRVDGPYEDKGPLVCRPVGAIDGFPMRDEKGRLYLLWKEDGNSVKKPTPIWASPLADDGLRIIGEPKQLIVNDAPWEGALVEGPAVLRKDGWFYLFYSGSACCGAKCDYALGVARARSLLGPWEKDPKNPILAGGGRFRCPGHGTVVADGKGRYFLLYHAYDVKDGITVGRQGLVDEVHFEKDGWPRPLGSPSQSPRTPWSFSDAFDGNALAPGWQRPHERDWAVQVDKGQLRLGATTANGDRLAALAARTVGAASFRATTRMMPSSAPSAGLAVVGDVKNAVGVAREGHELVLWRRDKGKESVLTKVPTKTDAPLWLRVDVADGKRFVFSMSQDGRTYVPVGAPIDSGELPPWDLGLRVALTSSGDAKAPALFDDVEISER